MNYHVVKASTTQYILHNTSRRTTSRFRPEFRRSTIQPPTSTTTSTRAALRTRTTRRRLATPSTTVTSTLTNRATTTSRPTRGHSRFRLVTRKHFLSTSTTPLTTTALKDQSIESSNQESQEEIHSNRNNLTDFATALQVIQKAPVRATPKPIDNSTYTTIAYLDRSSKSYETNTKSSLNQLDVDTKVRRVKIPPTLAPQVQLTTAKIIFRKSKPVDPFDKINPAIKAYTYKPITEYDYYDDGDTRVVGAIPEHSKVLIHSSGVIQCLDQGNFPHPVSCKKFISCAKMETGNVLGWEYTCPKNLSFDPVGGMCNWSAGLGCDE